MSHFVGLVAIPKLRLPGTEDDRKQMREDGYLSRVLEAILEPWDENKETPGYEQDCSCIGAIAHLDARIAADKRFGTHEDLRKRFFAEIVPTLGEMPDQGDYPAEEFSKKVDEFFEKRNSAWQAFVADRVAFEGECLAAHPGKNYPDPECENCKGTGKYVSTYNPKSKWDWWTIGGRWTGFLSDYDPTTDPENQEECFICHGTGDRPGCVTYVDANGNEIDAWTNTESHEVPSFFEEGKIDTITSCTAMSIHISQRMPEKMDSMTRQFKDDWAKECNGCNACKGQGTSLKFRLNEFDGDVLPVEKVRGLFKNNREKHSPFCFVDLDGNWHERGEMGWFGMSSNEKDMESWYDEVERLLDETHDAVIVVVDFHI